MTTSEKRRDLRRTIGVHEPSTSKTGSCISGRRGIRRYKLVRKTVHMVDKDQNKPAALNDGIIVAAKANQNPPGMASQSIGYQMSVSSFFPMKPAYQLYQIRHKGMYFQE